MGAGAEGEMTVRAARKIESIRGGKFSGIAIRSSNAKGQISTGLESHVADDHALYDEPVAQLVGALEAQELLDRGADQLRRLAQLWSSSVSVICPAPSSLVSISCSSPG